MTTEYRHPVSGRLTEKSLGNFLGLFDQEVRPAIIERLAREDVDGVVCFTNIALDSSQCGHRTAMIFGPGCTYKTIEECAAGHLGDVPSRFQYPQEFYLKAPAVKAEPPYPFCSTPDACSGLSSCPRDPCCAD